MNSSQFGLKDYEPFFERINNFKVARKKEIDSGGNDYNVITALLRQSDEVRLHSRFIFSLINPDGKHYQGCLFLESFISIIGVNEFDYESAVVKRERDSIDLYITDGNIHIIIENKIDAVDQKEQLQRYINTVMSKYISEKLTKEEVYKRIHVVYLTPKKRVPSKQSLGIWSIINDDHIQCTVKNDKYNGYILHYINITYVKHINAWLDVILDQSKSLYNLPFSIESYQDVIKRMTKIKRSNLMTIEEHLLDYKNIEDLKISGEISKKFELIKGTILFNFFNNIKNAIINTESNDSTNLSSADHMSNLKQFVHNNDKCKKWYKTGKAKEHYIGTYFVFDDNIQFGVMAASANLHIVLICSDNTYAKLLLNNQHFFNDYLKRDWKSKNTFTYYSKDTKHNIFDGINNPDVLELLSDKNNKGYKNILKDLFDVAINIKTIYLLSSSN